MSATYKPTTTSQLPPKSEEDSVDLTNITVHVGAIGTGESQPTVAAPCWRGIIATLTQSTIVRYLVVLVVFALVIFFLERFLGTEVSQDLRSALADGVKQALQNAVVVRNPATSSQNPL
jgi:hypothetical protein